MDISYKITACHMERNPDTDDCLFYTLCKSFIFGTIIGMSFANHLMLLQYCLYNSSYLLVSVLIMKQLKKKH